MLGPQTTMIFYPVEGDNMLGLENLADHRFSDNAIPGGPTGPQPNATFAVCFFFSVTPANYTYKFCKKFWQPCARDAAAVLLLPLSWAALEKCKHAFCPLAQQMFACMPPGHQVLREHLTLQGRAVESGSLCPGVLAGDQA